MESVLHSAFLCLGFFVFFSPIAAVMEFTKDPTGYADPRHFHLYNESLFQNNFSTNGTDSLFPRGVKITIVIVYMIVCVVGLVGNCLVMYVIIR